MRSGVLPHVRLPRLPHPRRRRRPGCLPSLYLTKLADLPGVARLNSQITMKTIKAGGGLPIARP